MRRIATRLEEAAAAAAAGVFGFTVEEAEAAEAASLAEREEFTGEVMGEARGHEGTRERVRTVRGSSPRPKEGREGAGKAPESSRM